MDGRIVMDINKRRIQIFEGVQGGRLVIYHAVQGEGDEIWMKCRQLKSQAFSLAVINDVNWNHEMSPWPAPSVFKGRESFGGGADDYLQELLKDILPGICNYLSAMPKDYALAGYSLAGLFSVYASFITNKFSYIASVSGSLWYPGFVSFVKEHEVAEQIRAMYFSLGDKESRTGNSQIAPVEANTEDIVKCLQARGICSVFEKNRGNHFQNMAERMAKGISWIVGQ